MPEPIAMPLGELYRTYGPVIYERCLRILKDAAGAEDATQEVFIRVHRHLGRAPSQEEVLLWIYRIATNLCINTLRNRARQAQPVAELPERPGPHVEGLLVTRDLMEKLARQVNPKLVQVGWLYHVDGLDQGEVARVLGLSRRTVAERLARFHQRARIFVQKESR